MQRETSLTFVVDVELIPRDDLHDLIGLLYQHDR